MCCLGYSPLAREVGDVFDCVIIDKLSSDGVLDSFHIRSREKGGTLTTDKLEDIDPSFRSVDSKDMAGIRLYEDQAVESRVLQSKLENYVTSPDGSVHLQFEHWGIPDTFGYYAIIFPKGYRIREIGIYDPYDKAENPESKRLYRGL
jgi:hypothetical protein